MVYRRRECPTSNVALLVIGSLAIGCGQTPTSPTPAESAAVKPAPAVRVSESYRVIRERLKTIDGVDRYHVEAVFQPDSEEQLREALLAIYRKKRSDLIAANSRAAVDLCVVISWDREELYDHELGRLVPMAHCCENAVASELTETPLTNAHYRRKQDAPPAEWLFRERVFYNAGEALKGPLRRSAIDAASITKFEKICRELDRTLREQMADRLGLSVDEIGTQLARVQLWRDGEAITDEAIRRERHRYE